MEADVLFFATLDVAARSTGHARGMQAELKALCA